LPRPKNPLNALYNTAQHILQLRTFLTMSELT